MIIPYFLILLRIRTFSDSSILPETGIGYDPIQSYILSLLGSIGFPMVFIGFFSNELPLYFTITILILTLIASLIPIFPDYLNKFLSYDIRTEKGQKFLWILSLIFVAILFVFMFTYFIFVLNTPISELLLLRLGGS